jgi:integrase
MRVFKIVNGKKLNPWTLQKEKYTVKGDPEPKLRFAIRRWCVNPDGTKALERLPAKRYASIRNNEQELEAFVRRLNAEEFAEETAKERILDRRAFLNEKLLEQYAFHLAVRRPRKATAEMNCLRRHAIDVFVSGFGKKNPKDWLREEDRWYNYLLNDPKAPGSTRSKIYVLQCLNRFLNWLHRERRDEMPLFQFEGPGQDRLERVDRDRVASGEKKSDRRDIPEEDWKAIREALEDDTEVEVRLQFGKIRKQERWEHIRYWAFLAYDYGLREAETMGLTFEGPDCVYTDSIELKRQLDRYSADSPTYTVLKSQGRNGTRRQRKVEKRDVPHWMHADAERTADWIEKGRRFLMHPNTLCHEWAEFISTLVAQGKLKRKWQFHELRHTWITRARAAVGTPNGPKSDREVQLAAGHASIETTEGYSHDHRKFQRVRVRDKKRAA